MSISKTDLQLAQLEAYCDILNMVFVGLDLDKYMHRILGSCDMLCERYEITKFKVQFDKLNNQFKVIQIQHENNRKNRPNHPD